MWKISGDDRGNKQEVLGELHGKCQENAPLIQDLQKNGDRREPGAIWITRGSELRLFSGFQLMEYPGKCSLQRRKIQLNGRPQSLDMYIKIGVNQFIAGSSDCPPGNIRYSLCTSSGICFAASPIISSARVTANIFSSFFRKSSGSIPCRKEQAFSAAWSISSRYTE